jgi:anti-anti-sigma factor
MKALLDDTNLILKFEESLISTTVKRLREQCFASLAQSQRPGSVTFDLSQVDMIDSQGLNFIIGIFNDTQKDGIAFRLVGASQANKKLFALVNLSEHVPVIG